MQGRIQNATYGACETGTEKEKGTEKKRNLQKVRFYRHSWFRSVGFIIGADVSSISNALKEVANGVNSGLQALRKKIATILPSLLGAILRLVFLAAIQAIGFLGKKYLAVHPCGRCLSYQARTKTRRLTAKPSKTKLAMSTVLLLFGLLLRWHARAISVSSVPRHFAPIETPVTFGAWNFSGHILFEYLIIC